VNFTSLASAANRPWKDTFPNTTGIAREWGIKVQSSYEGTLIYLYEPVSWNQKLLQLNQRDLELRHHLSLRKAWFRVVSSCRRFQIGTQNLLTTPLRDLPSHQAPRTLHPRIMNTHSPLVLTNLTEGGNNVSFLLPYKS